jgi:hypothetical protein
MLGRSSHQVNLTPVRANVDVAGEYYDSYLNPALAVVRHEALVLPRYVVEFEHAGGAGGLFGPMMAMGLGMMPAPILPPPMPIQVIVNQPAAAFWGNLGGLRAFTTLLSASKLI